MTEAGRRWFRRGDLLVLLAVLAAAGISALIFVLTQTAGGMAVVQTPEQTLRLPLGENTTVTLTGGGHTVTVEVSDGRVRFAEADCPDKLCVHSGWLSKGGQSAACLPAGILLRVEGVSSDYDALAE